MLKKIRNTLRDVLFPLNYTCDLCGREVFGTNLCADCAKTVTFNNKTTCPVCGRKTVRAEICLECKSSPPKYKRAVSAIVYEGGGIRLVADFKNGKAYLKEFFADRLAEKLNRLPPPDCIVYVPMTKKSLNARGYNQTKLLAKAVSKRTGTPVIYDAVQKVKDTAAQKGLTHRERRENLKGAFKAVKRESLAGKSVLVIDDVLTTGATADEVCSAILKAGAAQVYFASVASVEYKTIPQSK